MSRFFDVDSPVMSTLNKIADIIYLNFLTAICCIPIFTIGASMTALHYVMLKMVRNEEGYVTKSFFKSFKQNFKQATIIWLIILLFVVIFIGDILIFNYSSINFSKVLKIVLFAVALFALIATAHIFPLLSRFDNSIKNTFKNSLFMGILSFPKTVCMVLVWCIPVAIMYFSTQLLPVVFLFGISGPAYICALLYNKTFKKFEPSEDVTKDEDWTVAKEEETVASDGSAQESGDKIN